MKCHVCKTNDAHVHVIDVKGPDESSDSGYVFEERDVCDECAARMDLPSVPTEPIISQEVLNLLHSAKRPQGWSGLTCPHCGMTLQEFRSKGRLGCPHDYEVFREHLDPLLQRIHNADHHVGRIPGGEAAPPVDEPETAESSAAESSAAESSAAESGTAGPVGGKPAKPKGRKPAGKPKIDVADPEIDAAELAAALEEAGEGELAERYRSAELRPSPELTEAMLRRQALKAQLQTAVGAEDYERAAVLRDSLTNLADEIRTIVRSVAEPPTGA
ncbi:UvrB/UvrC motif-containing protein [Engelhardtia mirabilis]|uniref:UvrB/uvrC motif protein n=1 Tax=Engelhardtia mirabilis TaxID=2528011 RepID=A0A518BQJ8_9BACT|nr:UvrB/uvrC motif protein [Planctomycetes bacterium Pla133]QDV03580.1 UvrB/uvrC motif protein [Planctomycetes bacterium Pla86]